MTGTRTAILPVPETPPAVAKLSPAALRVAAPTSPIRAVLAVAALVVLAAPMAALPPDRWAAAAVFGVLLLANGWLDLRCGIVHAALALPMALGGLLYTWLSGAGTVVASAAGAVLGYLALRLVEAGFRRLRGHDGLGRGDAWVLGAAGAWVGPGGLGAVVAGAAAVALAFALVRDRRFAPDASLPFVPALAGASWIVWLAAGGAPS